MVVTTSLTITDAAAATAAAREVAPAAPPPLAVPVSRSKSAESVADSLAGPSVVTVLFEMSDSIVFCVSLSTADPAPEIPPEVPVPRAAATATPTPSSETSASLVAVRLTPSPADTVAPSMAARIVFRDWLRATPTPRLSAPVEVPGAVLAAYATLIPNASARNSFV